MPSASIRRLVGLVTALVLTASGMLVAAAPAAAEPLVASLAGTVTGSDAPSGLAGVWVELETVDGDYAGAEQTAEDGSYAFADVEPGEYRVYFGSYGNGYLSEWWDDQATQDTATVLTLAAGDAPAVDAELALGARIEGTVLADQTGAPVEFAEVVLLDEAQEWLDVTETGPDGAYAFVGVAPGTYYLQFTYYGELNLVGEWWDDADQTSSTPIAITGVTGATADASLGAGGSITGTVGADQPIGEGDAYLTAYDADGEWAGRGETDAEGDYVIRNLPSGSYTIRLQYSGSGAYSNQWWDGKPSRELADPVAVTVGEESTADFTLVAGGSITGTVTASDTEQGIDGVSVTATLDGEERGFAVTDEDGFYAFRGLADGEYVLHFEDHNDRGYASEWYDDADTLAAATSVAVTAGASRVANAELRSQLGTLSGTVVSTTTPAVPVDDVWITVLRDDGWENQTVRTDSNGRWLLSGLEPGTYYVSFQYSDYSEVEGQERWSSTWWWGGGALQRSAAPLEVVAGERTTADVALTVDASLRGTVSRADAPDSGLEDVRVRLYNPQLARYSASTTTDENGDYDFWAAVPPGTYYVDFDAPEGSAYLHERQTLTVGPADRAVLDVDLAKTGTISGKITGSDTGGAGIEDVWVSIREYPGGDYVWSDATDAQGGYTAEALPPGAYEIHVEGVCSGCADGPGYAPNAWSGDPILISNSGEHRVVNRVLSTLPEATASIWGRVGAGDDPDQDLGGIWVSAVDSDGEIVASDLTDDSGEFDVGPLLPGTYYVKYQCRTSCVYPAQWLGGSFTRTGSSTITVEAGDSAVASRLMRVGGEIQGTVRGTYLGHDDGVSGIYVNVSRPDGQPIDRAVTNSSIQTGSYGDYRIVGLPPGDYLVSFSAGYYGFYPQQWWGSAATVEDADLVQVVTNSATTANMWMHVGSSISGTVGRGSNSGDLNGIRVVARNGGYSKTGYLDASGHYSIVGLPPGTYTVSLGAEDDFPAVAQIGTVALPELGTPATLNYTYPALGRISGTLHNAYGEPVDRLLVDFYDATGTKQDFARRDIGSDGRYTSGPLLPGTYRVQYSCAPYSSCDIPAQWRGGAESAAESLVVVVGVGTTTVPVEELGPLHGVGGRVYADGELVDYPRQASVTAVDLDGNYVTGAYVDDGEYYLDLDPGRYRILFDPWSAPGFGASAVAVEVTDAYLQLDQELAEGATISGTVRPSGAPTAGLAGVTVILFDQYDRSLGAIQTDASGRYEITDLAAGEYTLRFSDAEGYRSQWYDGQPNGVRAQSLVLEPGEHMTVDPILLRLDEVLPVLTVTTPSITGTPSVGGTLTAVPGTWGPGGVTLSYQWRRDGSAITGATASSYHLTLADAGAAISVTVTGSRSGYQSASRTSAPTAVVTAGSVTSALPVIAGTPQVGQVLTAQPGSWTPSDVAFAYRWKRDGSPISGAVDSTYAPGAADVGHRLTVTVTGSKSGMTSAERTSAATAIVLSGALTGTAPTISGSAIVGQQLTAVPGAWSAGADLTYVWRRAGTPISGATSSAYTLVPADNAKAITVSVTGARPGYTSLTRTSGSVVPKLALTATPVPTITGVPSVGATLKAVPGTWAPKTVTLAYQWLRDGAVIPKATSSTYKLVAVDAEASITVRVTGSKSGYAAVARVSDGVDILAVLPSTPVPTVSGTSAVGQTLSADAGSWGSAEVDLDYQWNRNGSAISGATTSAYTLAAADGGTSVTVTVTGSRDGYTTVSRTSAARSIPRVLTATPVPTITGTSSVGSTLTAVAGSWAPKTVVLKYQWLREGVPISGATSSTYKLSIADATRTISVRVTGSRSGYTSVARVSAGRVIPDVLTASPVPVVSGDSAVGSTLTATPGAWGPGTVELAYQWKRNGVAIDGATGPTYLLVAADAGRSITVTVTGSREGFTSVARTSVARKLLTATPIPTIRGTAAVGQTLTAVPGTWSPKTVTLKYQWLRDGVPISGGTKVTYRVTSADAGAEIAVAVTGSRSGYSSVRRTSTSIEIP